MYEFSGYIEDEMGHKYPIDSSNFIKRGSSLKNTEFVIGIVAYAGHDTKIMLNSIRGKNKFSTLERSMNR